MMKIAVLGMSQKNFIDWAKKEHMLVINPVQLYAEDKTCRWTLVQTIRDIEGRIFNGVLYGDEETLLDPNLVREVELRIR